MKTLMMAIGMIALVGNSFAGDPVKNKLRSVEANMVEVSVYDASGVLVHQDNTSDADINFDLTEMRSGNYRVEVKSGGEYVNTMVLSNDNSKDAMHVRIVDARGAMVYHAAGDEALNFDLSNFPKGVYDLQIFVDAELVNSKEIRNK